MEAIDLNVINTGGPINRLPNEMMKHILAQLKTNYLDGCYYYDVKQLVQLRLVSSRWLAIVEDFCREKRSLVVNDPLGPAQLDLANPVFPFMNLTSVDSFGVVHNLFGNIVQLVIASWPDVKDYEMPNLALNIDQLSGLKQLGIFKLGKVLPFLSKTLSQLEKIGYSAEESAYILTEEEWLQFLCQLGPDCVDVHLRQMGLGLNYIQLRQWHDLKPHFLANVTNLDFSNSSDQNADYHKSVLFLSQHAPSLKRLGFFAQNEPLELTPTLVGYLANLTNLVQLYLFNLQMELPKFEEAAAQDRLCPLPSVLSCDLSYVYLAWDRSVRVGQFMRIMSIMFPNLSELTLCFNLEMETLSQKPPEVQEFVLFLDWFPHLRKRDIQVLKPQWTIDGREIPLDGFPFNIHV